MCDVSGGEDVGLGKASRTLLQVMLIPAIVIGAPYTFGADWKHVVHARESVSPACFVSEAPSIHPNSASPKTDRNRAFCAFCAIPRSSWQPLFTERSPNPRQRVPLDSWNRSGFSRRIALEPFCFRGSTRIGLIRRLFFNNSSLRAALSHTIVFAGMRALTG